VPFAFIDQISVLLGPFQLLAKIIFDPSGDHEGDKLLLFSACGFADVRVTRFVPSALMTQMSLLVPVLRVKGDLRIRQANRQGYRL
jgi:hypothetical protein